MGRGRPFQRSFESRADGRHCLTAYCWMEVARLRICFSGLGAEGVDYDTSFATAADGSALQNISLRCELKNPCAGHQSTARCISSLLRIERAGIWIGHIPHARKRFGFCPELSYGCCECFAFCMYAAMQLVRLGLEGSILVQGPEPATDPTSSSLSTGPGWMARWLVQSSHLHVRNSLQLSSQRGRSLLVVGL